MSIDDSAYNDPMTQQRLTNMAYYKCRQKIFTGKTALTLLALTEVKMKTLNHHILMKPQIYTLLQL